MSSQFLELRAQELIGACDREIAQLLEAFESKVDPPEGSHPESQDGQKRA